MLIELITSRCDDKCPAQSGCPYEYKAASPTAHRGSASALHATYSSRALHPRSLKLRWKMTWYPSCAQCERIQWWREISRKSQRQWSGSRSRRWSDRGTVQTNTAHRLWWSLTSLEPPPCETRQEYYSSMNLVDKPTFWQMIHIDYKLVNTDKKAHLNRTG